MRARGAVLKPRGTFLPEPADPSMGALSGDAELGGDVSDRAALTDHAIDQQQPPADVEAGITVGHETSWQ